MRIVPLTLVLFVGGGAAHAQTFAFDDQKAGAPKGMTCVLTGKAQPGSWKVLADTTAPSVPNVLAQTDADT
jgi:hypothetical protein